MTALEIINAIRETWGDCTWVQITVTADEAETEFKVHRSRLGASYRTLSGEWSPPATDGSGKP